jgi:hypothetical protein
MENTLLNRREVLASMAAAAGLTAMPMGLRAGDRTTLNFLMVGDWGRNGTSHQREVAGEMGKTAESLGCRHVISVGDNFYEEGVQSAGDWHGSRRSRFPVAIRTQSFTTRRANRCTPSMDIAITRRSSTRNPDDKWRRLRCRAARSLQ